MTNRTETALSLSERIAADTAEAVARGERCHEHPAFEPDNCPGCGTSAVIGRNW